MILRFCLVTTTSVEGLNRPRFRRLLDSLHGQGVDIVMHVVVRGISTMEPLPRLVVPGVNDVVIHAAPLRTSLSRARNIALAALHHDLLKDVIVAFPDDDCWYPRNLLREVGRYFPKYDVVTGSYSPHPPALDHARFSSGPCALDWKTSYESTASVTQFYAGDVVRAIGSFDERFGVGAKFESAEDADFLVRALVKGHRGYYDPSLVVGHPASHSTINKHYRGGLALLAKHMWTTHTARRLLVRRLAAGARSSLAGNLRFQTYIGAVVSAVRVAMRS